MKLADVWVWGTLAMTAAVLATDILVRRHKKRIKNKVVTPKAPYNPALAVVLKNLEERIIELDKVIPKVELEVEQLVSLSREESPEQQAERWRKIDGLNFKLDCLRGSREEAMRILQTA